MTRDVQRLFVNRRGSLRIGPRDLVQIGVVCAPEEIAAANRGRVERTIAETQFQLVFAQRRDLVNTPAFFGFFRAAPAGGIKHYTIARFEGRGGECRIGRDDHTHRSARAHPADQHAAMARRAPITTVWWLVPLTK